MCAAVLQTVLHKDPALCQVVLTEIPPFSVFKIVTEAIQITWMNTFIFCLNKILKVHEAIAQPCKTFVSYCFLGGHPSD